MGSTPEDTDAAKPVVVKKYANRRLYNTESSSYITLETLSAMVRDGRDFAVFDAKTGDDITRSVLTQIIVEEESKGRAMLPTDFMRHLIGFYGDAMQPALPPFLEQAMGQFARQQQQIRSAMEKTIGGFLPPGVEEMSRQNMAMMERAMALFAPFYRETGAAPGARTASPGLSRAAPSGPAPSETAPSETGRDQELGALRHQVQRLQAELDALRQTSDPEPAERNQPVTVSETRSGKAAGSGG